MSGVSPTARFVRPCAAVARTRSLVTRKRPHSTVSAADAAAKRLVLVRHGESIWNKEKRFTGWCDVPLTEEGEQEAHEAGSILASRGFRFDVAFTR